MIVSPHPASNSAPFAIRAGQLFGICERPGFTLGWLHRAELIEIIADGRN